MTILKRIEAKKGEMTLGVLLAAFVSMGIIAVCLVQMEGYDDLKFVWFLFFIAANIIYIGVGMKRGYAKPDPTNALVIASGPLAFFFWAVVGTWNKYVATKSKPVKLTKKMVVGEVNKGVADANKKIPPGTKAGGVYNVTIKSYIDILRELNDEITGKLAKFDVFDIEVQGGRIRMEQFLQIVEERNLDYRRHGYKVGDKEVVVVGKKGINFGQYEEGR